MLLDFYWNFIANKIPFYWNFIGNKNLKKHVKYNKNGNLLEFHCQ